MDTKIGKFYSVCFLQRCFQVFMIETSRLIFWKTVFVIECDLKHGFDLTIYILH